MGLAVRPLEEEQRGVIAEAILFLSRPNVRPVVRQELKTLGVLEIHTAETVDACIATLRRREHALLIVDWEQGERTLNAVLRAAQGPHPVCTRPIFMITAEIDRKVVAIGAEFNVSRILAGEISRGAIQEHLEVIASQEADPNGISASLARVADARAKGDAPMARVLLTDLIKRQPGHPRLVCEFADFLIEQDEWDQALDILQDLISRDPEDLRGQHLYARCLMKQGRFHDATEVLKSCQLINPHHVDRLVDLGNSLIQVDRVKEALAAFEAALDLEANNPAAIRGQGECKLLEGDVNAALALLRRVSGPREIASIFNNAAILSIRQGRFQEGVSLYHTAIGTLRVKDGTLARLLFNLGIAYHKWHKPEEALECFEQAIALDTRFHKPRHNATVLASLLARRDDEFEEADL